MKVAVLGAGAIGAYVGAALHRAGADVQLIACGPRLAAIGGTGCGCAVRASRTRTCSPRGAPHEQAPADGLHPPHPPPGAGLPREFTLDGEEARVPEGSTVLDACRAAGKDVPTLCRGDTLTPKNACRVCVVEVEGSRALVPACSRRAEPGMVVRTGTERARHSRKVVLELLASSVDLSATPRAAEWIEEYGARPDRFGPDAARFEEEPRIDNDLYVRDYGKCILCYKCVDACGDQWQNTFAISVAGRGFDARISVEHDAPLTDSACVYCGNCVEVCPTGALSARSEYDMRAAGTWDETRQKETTTVCAYCGVGCGLTPHVQDNEIVKVTSPHDNPVTHGNLCIKGRFGYRHVQNRDRPDGTD